MTPLMFVCILTGLIHFTETLSSSMRVAGVRTKNIATSLSFVNATLLVARMSNMLQAPLLGGMVDTAIIKNNPGALLHDFRIVVFAAFIGNLVGALFVPFFVSIFTEGILEFEKVGSLPKIILLAFHPKNLSQLHKKFRLPTHKTMKNITIHGMPKTFLILNILMVSIYAIGVLSSLYAGARVPAFRVTATQLSGIVNGIATILLTLLVDPTCAHITDQAIKGKRKEDDVRTMVFYIIAGRVLGTLLISQLIFLPASDYILNVTLFVKRMFGQ
jgi:hypothetical protein